MSEIFISCAEEDSPFVEQARQELTGAGYTLRSFSLISTLSLLDASKVIKRMDAIAFIISANAFKSPLLTREIILAHECDTPCLAVLIGVTESEMRERRPDWAEALSSSILVVLPEPSALGPQMIGVLERLVPVPGIEPEPAEIRLEPIAPIAPIAIAPPPGTVAETPPADERRAGTDEEKISISGWLRAPLPEVIARHYGLTAIKLAEAEIDPSLTRMVPREYAEKHNLFPVKLDGNTLTVAMSDPTNLFAIDEIRFLTGYLVAPVVASLDEIKTAIADHYEPANRSALFDMLSDAVLKDTDYLHDSFDDPEPSGSPPAVSQMPASEEDSGSLEPPTTSLPSAYPDFPGPAGSSPAVSQPPPSDEGSLSWKPPRTPFPSGEGTPARVELTNAPPDLNEPATEAVSLPAEIRNAPWRSGVARKLAWHRGAERISREIGDLPGVARSLNHQAIVIKEQGDSLEAMALLKQAERICRESGDRIGLAICLGNQATALYTQRRIDEAMMLFREKAQIKSEFEADVKTSYPDTDPVDCTVYAPPVAQPGDDILVQVFAHRPEQTQAANALAKQFDEESDKRGLASLETVIERGSLLMFHLTIPGCEVDEPVRRLRWRGSPQAVQFRVGVPEGKAPGNAIGTVTISQDSVPIGHIRFKLKITSGDQSNVSRKAEPVGDSARAYAKAFISYASPDRNEVLKRVQMLARLRISFFQDLLDLEPGDRWEKELYRHIDESDLFLLFWSSAARQSKWVLEEVRYAMKRKDNDELAPPEIIPVPLEGPPPVEPPDELSHIHFNDYFLYFMQRGDS